jgi:Tfp pilus assembly protein PilN
MLIMVLAVAVPERKITSLNESIDHKRVNLFQDTHALVKERASLDEQIGAINNQVNQINAVLDSRHDTDWPGLLNDVGKAIPKTVCMISLSSGADSVVLLKGLATSNEAVYEFVARLNKSERVNVASIAGTEKDSRGFISYEINCTPAPRKGK